MRCWQAGFRLRMGLWRGCTVADSRVGAGCFFGAEPSRGPYPSGRVSAAPARGRRRETDPAGVFLWWEQERGAELGRHGLLGLRDSTGVSVAYAEKK